MNCAEYESQIAEWVDGRLAPADAQAVALHVAGCPACGAFAASLRQLEAALVGGVARPQLTLGFEARLRARMDAEASGDLEAMRAERRRRLQAEYDGTVKRMRRRVRSVSSVLDMLGLGLLSAGALTAAVMHAPKLVQALPASVQARLDTPLVVGAALGTLVVLAATWLVTRRPSRLGSVL
jgi:anti-sigma factor RsiW